MKYPFNPIVKPSGVSLSSCDEAPPDHRLSPSGRDQPEAGQEEAEEPGLGGEEQHAAALQDPDEPAVPGRPQEGRLRGALQVPLQRSALATGHNSKSDR